MQNVYLIYKLTDIIVKMNYLNIKRKNLHLVTNCYPGRKLHYARIDFNAGITLVGIACEPDLIKITMNLFILLFLIFLK